MEETIKKIKESIEGRIYDLSDEKATQAQIEQLLSEFEVSREHRLSQHHVVDFMIDGVAVEIKVKGQATAILRQCEKYCSFDEVKALVLVTGRSMGFPEELNGKPCYYISLSKGML